MKSRAFRDAVKNDTYMYFQGDGKIEAVRGIEWIVSNLKRDMEKVPFLHECLGPEFALVPIPRSAPLSKGALWPTLRICEALVGAGLGAEVAPLLRRKTAVQKSASAPKGMRPGPEQHYESTEIDNRVPTLIERPLTMVDDIVTRGSSFVGMFQRLAEAYPGRKISCFALVQTVSGGDVNALKNPIRDKINFYQSGKLWRGTGVPIGNSEQPNLL